MDVRNCKRCGKIYNYTGGAVCNNCLRQEQEDFEKIREYLFKNPNSSTADVSEATGVELKVISRFLKEGRIEADYIQMSGDSALACEKCGKPVKTGRFCEDCIKQMQADFGKAAKSNSTTNKSFQTNKVHTFEHILRRKY
ncbi:MAG: MerR family transcriptional regulator [Firmicutes bacterium]|nr:MerR family transcriptional regulator [Bacillota bacterium]